MKTQCQMIREHLEAGYRLSPIEALDKFGCFRLASRINELRKQGLDIRTDIVEGVENGKRWAEYWLHRDSGLLEAPEQLRKVLPRSPDKDDAMALASKASLTAPGDIQRFEKDASKSKLEIGQLASTIGTPPVCASPVAVRAGGNKLIEGGTIISRRRRKKDNPIQIELF